MEYTTALDIGKRKRQQGGINEDSVAVNLVEEGHRDTDRLAGVFVLADGAGGADAGDVASYVATVEVARQLTEYLWNTRRCGEVLDLTRGGEAGSTPVELAEEAVDEPLADVDDASIRVSIEAAIQNAHVRLLEVIDDLDVETAYSTIVAGVKVGDRLHYGWVGDSRIYAVNTAPSVPDDDRVQLLTRDHSVVERMVEQGEIDEVEAYVHRRGNRVTRVLGGARGEDPEGASVEVDTNSVPLFRDDVVLLTSDGLVDAYIGAPQLHQRYEQAEDTTEIEAAILENAVTDDEIRDVIMEADTLPLAGERFVSLSNERGGKDNISVVLFRDADLPQTPSGGPAPRTPDSAAERTGDPGSEAGPEGTPTNADGSPTDGPDGGAPNDGTDASSGTVRDATDPRRDGDP